MTIDSYLKAVIEAAHKLPPPDMALDFIHISPPFCFKPTTSFDETTKCQIPAWELVAAMIRQEIGVITEEPSRTTSLS